jgi:hypothetical protein
MTCLLRVLQHRRHQTDLNGEDAGPAAWGGTELVSQTRPNQQESIIATSSLPLTSYQIHSANPSKSNEINMCKHQIRLQKSHSLLFQAGSLREEKGYELCVFARLHSFRCLRGLHSFTFCHQSAPVYLSGSCVRSYALR